MNSFLHLLRFLFYPNPGGVSYGSSSQMALLVLCAVLVGLSIGIRVWRKGLQNPITKKLSRSWSVTLLWLGIVGFVLVVARVEQIQFLAMRFMWVVWVLAAAAYAVLQWRLFTAKHYEVLPKVKVVDAREKYLPGKKR